MIELEIQIPCPVATAWTYLTQNKHLEKWWGEGVSLDARKGGNFIEPWTDKKGDKHVTMGRVTALEEGVRLQMDWMEPGWVKATRVEFLLGKSIDGAKLYLQHSGWDLFDQKERQKTVDRHLRGWQEVLDNFKRYCSETP